MDAGVVPLDASFADAGDGGRERDAGERDGGGRDGGGLPDAGSCDPRACVAPVYGWDRVVGGPGRDRPTRVSLDEETGTVLAAGYFRTMADFGGGARDVRGTPLFVAAYDAEDGAHVWDRSIATNTEGLWGLGLATGAEGGYAVSSTFYGTVDFGSGSRTSTATLNTFVAAYDATGAPRWDRTFGAVEARSVAATPDGGVIVVGYFTAPTDFGGGIRDGHGTEDVFVVSYGPSGAYRWDYTVGTSREDEAFEVAIGSDGGIYVTGVFAGELDFGGGLRVSGRDADVFVLALTADGDHRWDRTFGGPGYDYPMSLAIDDADQVYIAGQFMGTASLGGADRTAAGTSDSFVTVFSGAGVHRWDHVLGGSTLAMDVDVDDDGRVLVGGAFLVDTDFGGGLRSNAGSFDAFVVAFAPSGRYLWDYALSSPGHEEVRSLTATRDDGLIAIGSTQGGVDFGGGTRPPLGDYDTFLLRLDCGCED